jgi:hypothetical protein
MSVLLPAPTRDKLAKVCGLLGSNHDGERAAAAHQATEILRRHGLTWAELILATPAEASDGGGWRAMRRECARHPKLLTDWELAFVTTIARRTAISDRQREVLERIVEKVREERA